MRVSTQPPESAAPTPWARTVAATRHGAIVATLGVLTGLGSAGLTWILHAVEELVYGHGEQTGAVLTDGVDPWRMSIGVAVVAAVLALA